MSIDVEALAEALRTNREFVRFAALDRGTARLVLNDVLAEYARLVPAEDEDACPHCGNYPGSRRWKLAHPAEDEGRLREALDEAEAFNEAAHHGAFYGGWKRAIAHVRAALAATPEPR